MNTNILPTKLYNGLSFILDKPSRFDQDYLISGTAGTAFDRAIHPYYRSSSHIKTAAHGLSFLPGTKVVVLLGEESLRLIESKNTLLESRGHPIVLDDIIYIPTFSPQNSIDLANWEAKFNPTQGEGTLDEDLGREDKVEKSHGRTERKNFGFWFKKDITKAYRILEKGITTYTQDLRICPQVQEVIRLLKTTKRDILFFDIETMPPTLDVSCFSFAFQQGPVYTLPVISWRKEYFYGRQLQASIMVALGTALRDNIVCAHNGSYDLFVMCYRLGIPLPRQVYDTMLAQNRIFAEVEKSLGHCVSLYTDLPYHKNQGVFNPNSESQQLQLWTYNAKDVFATREVYFKQQDLSFDLGAQGSIAHANDCVYPYLLMTFCGIKVDLERLKEKMSHHDRRRNQLLRLLRYLIGRDINPQSPKQVSSYLYDYPPVGLGLKRPKENETREDTLLHLAEKVPIVKLLLEYRGLGKEQGVLKSELWNNDRFTCQWDVGRTTTYRRASRKLLGRWGTNLQNQGRNKSANWLDCPRSIFIPDNGKEFLQLDQSGADAFIMAYLCKKGSYRQLFLEGIKPHIFVAMHLFAAHWEKLLQIENMVSYLDATVKELPLLPRWKELSTAIKQDELKYYLGKKTGHASNYGMHAFTYAESVLKETEGKFSITVKEAERALSIYNRELFPEIPLYHREIQDELYRNNRVLRNLYNHPRVFTGIWNDAFLREAYAFKPQSTVAINTSLCIVETQELIEGGQLSSEVDILADGHDSVLLQYPLTMREEVLEKVRPLIERTITYKGETFTMKSEAKTGQNWSFI